MKMSFHSHVDKTHFHIKSFARSLALKKRHKTIRKWPIFETVRGACASSLLHNNNRNYMNVGDCIYHDEQ